MARKPQMPQITKEEFLEAITEGVDRAVYAMITDRCMSFYQCIEDGVQKATEKMQREKAQT